MKTDLRCLIEDLSRYVGGIRTRASSAPDGGPNYDSDEFRQRAFRTAAALHPRTMRIEVVEVIQETPSTRTFRFVRTDGEVPPFRPGQYVSLAVTIGDVRTTRAYSISSAPGLDHLDITVRLATEGFVSPFLFDRAEVGWQVTSTGPAGSFVHEPLIDQGTPLLIAGGSGITPFMSMIRHQVRLGWRHRIDLLYGSRTADDVIFGDELRQLAADQPEFGYRRVLSEPPLGYDGPAGYLDAEQIGALVADPTDRSVLICGPTAMYSHTMTELSRLGVPGHKIRRELYGPPADVTEKPGWPQGLGGSTTVRVEVVGRGSFTTPVGEPLLNGMERNGFPHRSSCRTGECADCRVRIRSGATFEVASGVRQADRARGYVHACVTYPLENLIIEL